MLKYKITARALFTLIAFFSSVFVAQTQVPYSQLYESTMYKSKYEIGLVSFRGNNNYTSETLETIISSTATDYSILYSVFEFSYLNLIDHPLVPAFVKHNLNSNLQTLENDISFFREELVDIDIANLRSYYHQHGFHHAKISYRFVPNYRKELNELIFYINEGKRYKLAALDFDITDSLPEEIDAKVHSFITIRPGSNFSEPRILNAANNIVTYLKSVGYFFATMKNPQVIIDNENEADSVYLNISPGPRCKIGSIQFIQNFNNQKILSNSLLKSQLTIEEGDWYNNNDITKTESNFLSLSAFQYVRIDTSKYNPADSTLNFLVDLRYKKQQEYGFSSFINRTMFEKYLNAGFELSYTHKNAFGSAQVFNPFARIVMLDVSKSINDISNAEYEYQFGLSLSQPLLWKINSAKVGVISQLMYSKRTIYDELRLTTFSLPIKFPITFSSRTYFNLGSLEFGFERQMPNNYPTAIENALQTAESSQDTIDIFKRFMQFEDLYNFVEEKKPFLTSTTLGFSISGDNRNDPFYPTSGHYATINLDIAPFKANKYTGVSNYIKLQLLYTTFLNLSPKSVLALKIRGGHIFWMDRSNSLVPYDRQFFAGGANSVRGWASRRLRYFGVSQRDAVENEYFHFTEDFIGSTSIIEGSFEWRYKLVTPSRRNTTFQQYLEGISLAFFIDYGNAYQWFYYSDDKDYTYKPKLIDYLKGLAVAYGAGIRYDTPVGAIRLDLGWKLYDPNSQFDPDLYPAVGKLSDIQFHIGLGTPF